MTQEDRGQVWQRHTEWLRIQIARRVAEGRHEHARRLRGELQDIEARLRAAEEVSPSDVPY